MDWNYLPDYKVTANFFEVDNIGGNEVGYTD